MSDRAIVIVRWILLGSAAFNLLQATVLHGALHRYVLRPWYAAAERAGGRVPGVMRDERLVRAWAALMAALFAAFWWYTGTPDGAAMLRRMFGQAGGV